jgi:TPP-dependent pyruvate/acetoin dehydrogenase alpha subunit
VDEMTQPQGHSTSGSHERYKPPERLEWEREWDGIRKMKEWILENTLSSDDELNDLEHRAKEFVRESRAKAWEKYLAPIRKQVSQAIDLINNLAKSLPAHASQLVKLTSELVANHEPLRRDVLKNAECSFGPGRRT